LRTEYAGGAGGTARGLCICRINEEIHSVTLFFCLGELRKAA
jgi:hypothetical protein